MLSVVFIAVGSGYGIGLDVLAGLHVVIVVVCGGEDVAFPYDDVGDGVLFGVLP
jgi:hypothetical protein